MKIESEEAPALRTLIFENCEDELLRQHPRIDSHEFMTLVSFLERYKSSSNAKLETQVKSEVLIAIEAFLSRGILRERLSPECMNHLETVVKEQSFSKLPRVRSIAKTLSTKLKSVDSWSSLENNIQGGFSKEGREGGSKIELLLQECDSRTSAQDKDKKPKIYLNPESQTIHEENPIENPEAKSIEFKESQPIGDQAAVVETNPNESIGNVVESKATLDNNSKEFQEIQKSVAQSSGAVIPQESPDESKEPQNRLEAESEADSRAPVKRAPLHISQETNFKPGDTLAGSPSLKQKRDFQKQLKQHSWRNPGRKSISPGAENRLDESTSTELKRGLFLLEDPLLSMTKGKGWGPNIRAKNYLKKYSRVMGAGMGADTDLADTLQQTGPSQRVRERRESRNRSRQELREQVYKNRASSKSAKKFHPLYDEDAEKERKRRLLMIAKGINPDDPNAEELLKELLEKQKNDPNYGKAGLNGMATINSQRTGQSSPRSISELT